MKDDKAIVGVLVVGGAVGLGAVALAAAAVMAQNGETPSDIQLTIYDKYGNLVSKGTGGVIGAGPYEFVEGEPYTAVAAVTNSSIRGPEELPWEAQITTVIRLVEVTAGGDVTLDDLSDTRLFAAGETIQISWQFTIPYGVGGSTGRIEAALLDPSGNVILGADGLPAIATDLVNFIGADLVYAFTGLGVTPSGGSIDEGQDYSVDMTLTNASARGAVVPEAVAVQVRLTLFLQSGAILKTATTTEVFDAGETRTISMPFHLPYDLGEARALAVGEILDAAGNPTHFVQGLPVTILEIPIVYAFVPAMTYIERPVNGAQVDEGTSPFAFVYLQSNFTRGGVGIDGVGIRVENEVVIDPDGPTPLVFASTDQFLINHNEIMGGRVDFTAPYGTVPVGQGSVPAKYTANVYTVDTGELILTLESAWQLMEVPVEYRGGVTF